ncbi:MAG: hypothetical protein SGARI_000085 [Bacillariaceae sp.]
MQQQPKPKKRIAQSEPGGPQAKHFHAGIQRKKENGKDIVHVDVEGKRFRDGLACIHFVRRSNPGIEAVHGFIKSAIEGDANIQRDAKIWGIYDRRCDDVRPQNPTIYLKAKQEVEDATGPAQKREKQEILSKMEQWNAQTYLRMYQDEADNNNTNLLRWQQHLVKLAEEHKKEAKNLRFTPVFHVGADITKPPLEPIRNELLDEDVMEILLGSYEHKKDDREYLANTFAKAYFGDWEGAREFILEYQPAYASTKQHFSA